MLVKLPVYTEDLLNYYIFFQEEKPKGLFPAYYNYKDLYTSGKRGVSPLDNNHTHFILVDDGREKKFGAEIMFRAEFENYVSKANRKYPGYCFVWLKVESRCD